MESKNIYILIIVFAILFLLLDYVVTNLHFRLENFSNPPALTPSMVPSESVNNLKIKEEKFNEMGSLINNSDLKIQDFYPQNRADEELPFEQLKQNIFKHNLFHQILPKFGGGYLGVIWHEPNLYGIYTTNNLLPNMESSSPEWKLLPDSIPTGMLRPVFMSFDQDRKLLVIFEEQGTFNVNKYHLYKKEEVDLNSEFKFIEKSKICTFIFDDDERLVGLDEKGKWYKKVSRQINSQWERIEIGFTNIPMRKLMFDYRSKYMIGLGQDFRIYKKRNTDWLNDEWDTLNGPSSKTFAGTVRDLWYDFDGILMGLSRFGLVKQDNTYYLSNFKLFKDEIVKKSVSLYKILYASTGVKVFGNLANNNNTNNVYVDGKKISEYKFKDPRLNKYLKHRMDMKKKCRKIKAMKIDKDESQKEVPENIRNDRFMRVLNEQKDTIDNLMDTISFLRNKE
jgi:hypothetical protein